MKKRHAPQASRNELGRISIVTLGDIKGQVEAFGIYTPRLQLD